jgi:hypothetical protein
MVFVCVTGCALERGRSAVEVRPTPPLVVAVAPVLNLSNSSDWDSLRVTDILASELQTFPGMVVIPVNRALAALRLMGKTAVETQQDALDLAEELGADATLVAAITEYQPYDPPIVGVVMQWYAHRSRSGSSEGFDPVSASRQASEMVPAGAGELAGGRLVQIQRVFNAADESVLAEIREFAARRSGHESPYAWRVYLKSQELFVRFSFWASIGPIHTAVRRAAPGADETKSWTQEGDA